MVAGGVFLEAPCSLAGRKQALVLPAGLSGRDYLAAQTIALAARLVTFAAPFNQEFGRQRAQHGVESGRARQWRDVVEHIGLHRVLRLGVDDRLLPFTRPPTLL